jgi:hypothetical protein
MGHGRPLGDRPSQAYAACGADSNRRAERSLLYRPHLPCPVQAAVSAGPPGGDVPHKGLAEVRRSKDLPAVGGCARVASGQQEGNGPAQLIGQNADLCGASAARHADCLVVFPRSARRTAMGTNCRRSQPGAGSDCGASAPGPWTAGVSATLDDMDEAVDRPPVIQPQLAPCVGINMPSQLRRLPSGEPEVIQAQSCSFRNAARNSHLLRNVHDWEYPCRRAPGASRRHMRSCRRQVV